MNRTPAEKSASALRVMGIDPGLADVGWGVIELDARTRQPRHIAHGVVQTRAGSPMSDRLAAIHSELERLIAKHAPDCVAIEELFFASNVKTAIVVAQGRGVAILATARSGVPLAEYSPPRIKQALVGYGRASKRQIQMMVRARLGLSEIPRPDHAADALAVALCHTQVERGAGMRAGAAAREAAKSPPAEISPNKLLLAQARGTRRRRR